MANFKQKGSIDGPHPCKNKNFNLKTKIEFLKEAKKTID